MRSSTRAAIHTKPFFIVAHQSALLFKSTTWHFATHYSLPELEGQHDAHNDSPDSLDDAPHTLRQINVCVCVCVCVCVHARYCLCEVASIPCTVNTVWTHPSNFSACICAPPLVACRYELLLMRKFQFVFTIFLAGKPPNIRS